MPPVAPPRVEEFGFNVQSSAVGCPANPEGVACEFKGEGPKRCPQKDMSAPGGVKTCDCVKESGTYVCRNVPFGFGK